VLKLTKYIEKSKSQKHLFHKRSNIWQGKNKKDIIQQTSEWQYQKYSPIYKAQLAFRPSNWRVWGTWFDPESATEPARILNRWTLIHLHLQVDPRNETYFTAQTNFQPIFVSPHKCDVWDNIEAQQNQRLTLHDWLHSGYREHKLTSGMW